MKKSRKQNENEVKSRKVEDGIENVARRRGTSMMESRNVVANVESLRPLQVAGGTSTEWARRLRDIKCQRRHKRGRREARRPHNASISDRHTERLYWHYLENRSENAGEKSANCRE
jgi:hypothetical protein